LPQPALGNALARPPSEPPSPSDADVPLSPEPLLLEPLLLLELLLLEPAPPELLLLLELLLLEVLLLEPFDSPPSPAPASGIGGLADVHANGRRPKSESHTSDQARIRGAYPAQSAVQESNRSGVFQPEDNVVVVQSRSSLGC